MELGLFYAAGLEDGACLVSLSILRRNLKIRTLEQAWTFVARDSGIV